LFYNIAILIPSADSDNPISEKNNFDKITISPAIIKLEEHWLSIQQSYNSTLQKLAINNFNQMNAEANLK